MDVGGAGDTLLTLTSHRAKCGPPSGTGSSNMKSQSHNSGSCSRVTPTRSHSN